MWNQVTNITIRNCFRATGFSRTLSDQQTFKNDALSTIDGSNKDPTRQPDDLLSRVRIDGNQRSSADVVNISSNIPAFNERNDNRDFLVEIVGVDHIEDDEDEQLVKEAPPNLSEAIDMLQKLHSLPSTKQLQLQSLVNNLQSKLTDSYLDSKLLKQAVSLIISTRINKIKYIFKIIREVW